MGTVGTDAMSEAPLAQPSRSRGRSRQRAFAIIAAIAVLSGIFIFAANRSTKGATGSLYSCEVNPPANDDVECVGADLSGANLRGVVLIRANFNRANLTNADLRGANLTNADLRGSNLTEVDLTGADLTGADLTGAELTGADLTNTTWSNTTCPDGGRQPGLEACKALDGDGANTSNGRIAFMRFDDSGASIYSMNTDGTASTFISQGAIPTWSPNREKIAFFSGREGNDEIFVMNADGSNPQNITNHPESDTFPSWSPNGYQIAFTSTRDGNEEILVMNADGSNPQNITNNPEPDIFPVWSPNGEKIAFNRLGFDGSNSIFQILVMNTDGSDQQNIPSTETRAVATSWR